MQARVDRFCGRAGFRYLWFHQPSLIPTGLHQVLNTIAWFQIGDSPTRRVRFSTATLTASMPVRHRGDVHVRLLPDHDVRSAGAALAMYFAAPKERRPMVGGSCFLLLLLRS